MNHNTKPISEATPQELIAEAIRKLAGKLAEYEDQETAILIYKEANGAINDLGIIKQSCLQMIESQLRENGEDSVRFTIGSAGFTQPKKKQLDKGAWEEAVREDGRLAEVVREFERVKGLVEREQEGFMVWPEKRVFIR